MEDLFFKKLALTATTMGERSAINTPQEAAEKARTMIGEQIEAVEVVGVLFVDVAHRVTAWAVISEGGFTQALVDVRKFASFAVLSGATAAILVHNHPSGDLRPSKQDREITERIRKAGELLEIQLLDHLILSSEDYYSFEDNDLIS